MSDEIMELIDKSECQFFWTFSIDRLNSSGSVIETVPITGTNIESGTFKMENAIASNGGLAFSTMIIGKLSFTLFGGRTEFRNKFHEGDIIKSLQVVVKSYGVTLETKTFPKYHITKVIDQNYKVTITALDPLDYLNAECTLASGTNAEILAEIGTNVLGGELTMPSATDLLALNNDYTQPWTIPSGYTWRQVLLMLVPDGKYFRINGSALEVRFWGLTSWSGGIQVDDVLGSSKYSGTSSIGGRVGINYELVDDGGNVLYSKDSPLATATYKYPIRRYQQRYYSEMYGDPSTALDPVTGYLYSYLESNLHLVTTDTMTEVTIPENPLLVVGNRYMGNIFTSPTSIVYTHNGVTLVRCDIPSNNSDSASITQAEAITKSVEARLSDQIAEASITAEDNAKDYTDAQLANYTTDRLTSTNGTYTFQMQTDGNAVLYNGSTAEWNTNSDIAWKGHQDEAPQRLYTTDTASTLVPSGTSSFTNVRTFTVPTSGWYLVVLMQYINLTPSSGHFAMRIVDADSRNHTGYLSYRGSAGGGSLFLNFIGRFVAGTNYYISAVNTTNSNWTINRTLGDAELMLQYLHRNV